MHTKKVGSAGRYGNKYGSKIRRAVANAEKDSRGIHVCPKCLNKKLVRKAAGIWNCAKCKTTFAGGAYSPTTAATKIMSGEIEPFVEEIAALKAPEEKTIHVAQKTEEKSEKEDIKEMKTKKKTAAKEKGAKKEAKKK